MWEVPLARKYSLEMKLFELLNGGSSRIYTPVYFAGNPALKFLDGANGFLSDKAINGYRIPLVPHTPVVEQQLNEEYVCHSIPSASSN